jgi:hypothetical protein
MNNLTWTDTKAFIPNGSNPNWKWEETSTSTFKVSGGDAFWRITPIHTHMSTTSVRRYDNPEQTLWAVQFGSQHQRLTFMEDGYTYNEEWAVPPHHWAYCLNTKRLLFFSLEDAKAFCETTFGFSTMVDTRAVV